jgi:hypothetical protein
MSSEPLVVHAQEEAGQLTVATGWRHDTENRKPRFEASDNILVYQYLIWLRG